VNYQDLDDENLISLFFTEEDRLPREAVDEFVRRGDRMVAPLAKIVSNNYAWTRDLPEWWAVIHATFILGAIATKETVLPLLKALRFACVYDCDWITHELPSIFGRLGPRAVDGLKRIGADQTSDWFIRAHAMEGLAAITISHPETGEDIFGFIGSIFTDEKEDIDTRQSAGNVLLDFKREEYKESLLLFANKEKESKEKNVFYNASFFESDVIEALTTETKDLWLYTSEWLDFYAEENIRKRQERWRKEAKAQSQKEEEKDSVSIPFVHTTPKVGRNEPCPCGSGKKYKKCCGLSH
jgi:hypothetical protein